jgi:hypothetical protein
MPAVYHSRGTFPFGVADYRLLPDPVNGRSMPQKTAQSIRNLEIGEVAKYLTWLGRKALHLMHLAGRPLGDESNKS